VCLVTSVVDMLESDGKTIAILDASVNHLPEVFEYQFEPDVAEQCDGASNEYILAGASCLAGDVFGEYSFKEPLKIGSRVTFENVGAYTTVKATMFNGINLPSIYVLDEAGDLRLIREFTFEDFASRCGAPINDYANL
jgi:carboxynorspermidine decarboxylase